MWDVRIQELDLSEKSEETVLRAAGPPERIGENAVPDAEVVLRVLDETKILRTNSNAKVEVALSDILQRHLVQNGLKPLVITANESQLVVESESLINHCTTAPVDWSACTDAALGSASVDLYLDKSHYEVGETPVLELVLVNNGDGDLCRVWLRISFGAWRQVVFIGKVKSRELVKRSISLKPFAFEDSVRVEFFEERGGVPVPQTIKVSAGR
jgi:hypothetical protein